MDSRYEERPTSSCVSPVGGRGCAGEFGTAGRASIQVLQVWAYLFPSQGVRVQGRVTLPPRSAFHIFRHTYATWMRRYAGADEATLIATGAWKDAKSVKR